MTQETSQETSYDNKRIMALDLGSKRVGVALSDELGITAQPLGKITSTSTDKVIAEVFTIASEHSVGAIIVGVPINMNGTEGPAARRARGFIAALERATDCPVEAVDERLSTAAATRVLIEGGVSRGGRKEVVDKLSACFFLQGYLDRKRAGRKLGADG